MIKEISFHSAKNVPIALHKIYIKISSIFAVVGGPAPTAERERGYEPKFSSYKMGGK
jgi:hypothetical protein